VGVFIIISYIPLGNITHGNANYCYSGEHSLDVGHETTIFTAVTMGLLIHSK
jgi:hypothetical protein